MPSEREVRLRMPAQRSAAALWRLLDSKPQRHRVITTYLDTEKSLLERSRAALRLRRFGRRWLQCFKAEASDGMAFLGRLEWERPARGGRLRPAAFPLDEIRSTTGFDLASIHDRLRPVFTTRFVRQQIEHRTPSGQRIEVALDQGSIEAGNRVVPLREIKFELIEGDLVPMLEHVRALIPELLLELEVRSKAERGYQLAAGERAEPIKARRPRLNAEDDTGTALGSVIGGCVSQIAVNVHGVANSRDPEYLHQLRVGLRRLRSGIRVFRACASVEGTQTLVDGLRAQLPALGAARDWDVVTAMLERCITGAADEGVEVSPIVRWARRRRAIARRKARSVARSSGFQQLLLDVLIWVERARAEPTRPSAETEGPRRIGDLAKQKISKLARKAEQLGDASAWSDATARHTLRIRLKRLRYLCEFFAGCFKRKRLRRYLERLEALQDTLGELNDITTARRLLQTLNAPDRGLQLAFIRGWLSAREDALITELDAAWGAFRQQTLLG
jgi:inorganic triphosphatase YgiF